MRNGLLTSLRSTFFRPGHQDERRPCLCHVACCPQRRLHNLVAVQSDQAKKMHRSELAAWSIDQSDHISNKPINQNKHSNKPTSQNPAQDEPITVTNPPIRITTVIKLPVTVESAQSYNQNRPNDKLTNQNQYVNKTANKIQSNHQYCRPIKIHQQHSTCMSIK